MCAPAFSPADSSSGEYACNEQSSSSSSSDEGEAEEEGTPLVGKRQKLKRIVPPRSKKAKTVRFADVPEQPRDPDKGDTLLPANCLELCLQRL